MSWLLIGLSFLLVHCKTANPNASLKDVSDISGQVVKNPDGTYNVTCKDGSILSNITHKQAISSHVCSGLSEFTLVPRDLPGYNQLPLRALTSVAIGPAAWVVGSHAGVSVSTDNAKTWTNVGRTKLPSDIVVDVAINGQSIYAVTTNGLAISDDLGLSWRVADFTGGGNALVPKRVVFAGGNLYVSGVIPGGGADPNCLAVSADGGNTWVSHNKASGLPAPLDDGLVIAASGSNVFLSAQSGLMVSKDGGATWALNAVLGLPDADQSQGLLSIAVDGSNVYVVTVRNLIYASADLGKTWKIVPLMPENEAEDVNVVAVHAINGVIYANSDTTADNTKGYLFQRTPTTDWNAVDSENAGTTRFYQVAGVALAGTTVVAATTDGLSFSTDGGITWGLSRPTTILSCNLVGATWIVAEGKSIVREDSCSISISTDGGVSFTSQLPYGFDKSAQITSGVIYVTRSDSGFASSVDYGKNWTSLPGVYNLGYVHRMAFGGGQKFAAADQGLFYEKSPTFWDRRIGAGGVLNNDPTDSVVISGNTLLAHYPYTGWMRGNTTDAAPLTGVDTSALPTYRKAPFALATSNAIFIGNSLIGDPSNANDPNYNVPASSPLSVSTDGGVSWKPLSFTGCTGACGFEGAVRGKSLYLHTDFPLRRLFSTQDAGATWTSWDFDGIYESLKITSDSVSLYVDMGDGRLYVQNFAPHSASP